MIFDVRTLVPGKARGRVAAIAPLSFWGGYDAASGTIVERSHPDFGRTLQGRILVMTAGRGSSSSSSVLAEAIRLGTAPAAIVLAEPDSILAVGARLPGRGPHAVTACRANRCRCRLCRSGR